MYIFVSKEGPASYLLSTYLKGLSMSYSVRLIERYYSTAIAVLMQFVCVCVKIFQTIIPLLAEKR